MKIPKSKRARRVGVEIQKIVAEMIRNEMAGFAPGSIVSVPEVRVSDDLEHSILYCSIHTVDDPSPIQKHLLKFLPLLRREVARHLHIRKIPEMRFVWDDTYEKADRIEQLLNKAHQADEAVKDSSEDQDSREEE